MINNLRPRVIPTLLILNCDLVKTTRFSCPSYLGDPLNIIKIFNDKEVDELVILDISPDRHIRGPNFTLLSDLSSECLMPLAYGGGIRHLEDAKIIFRLGFEKVILQHAAFRDISILTEISSIFGSQSVVFSLDVRRGFFKLLRPNAFNKRYINSCSYLMNLAANNGAGEIFINFVHNEGTGNGMDLEAIRLLSSVTNVPIVFCGGVNSLEDIRQAFLSGADGVGVGSMFVYQGKRKGVLVSYLSPEQFSSL